MAATNSDKDTKMSVAAAESTAKQWWENNPAVAKRLSYGGSELAEGDHMRKTCYVVMDGPAKEVRSVHPSAQEILCGMRQQAMQKNCMSIDHLGYSEEVQRDLWALIDGVNWENLEEAKTFLQTKTFREFYAFRIVKIMDGIDSYRAMCAQSKDWPLVLHEKVESDKCGQRVCSNKIKFENMRQQKPPVASSEDEKYAKENYPTHPFIERLLKWAEFGSRHSECLKSAAMNQAERVRRYGIPLRVANPTSRDPSLVQMLDWVYALWERVGKICG